MTNNIKIFFLTISILLFTACGSAGGESKDNDKLTITIPMQKGVPVAIDAGYKIISSDPDALVDIIVIDNNKTATLISGVASIEKPI